MEKRKITEDEKQKKKGEIWRTEEKKIEEKRQKMEK